jgi:hypothetical protein
MAVPLTLIAQTVAALMRGPVNKILDLYVKDLELRRKLQAELEGSLITHVGQSLELQQSLVLAEIQSERWLTATWRPLLMVLMMGFLVLVGLVLPLADLAAGKPIPWNPRWSALPDGFWQFLSVGVGGYIGGRSLEKIATQVIAVSGRKS